MIRAYLLALSMLGLGIAGVVVIASQASRSPAQSGSRTDAMDKDPQATAPMGMSRRAPRPRSTLDAAVAQAMDAAAPRPVATPDAAVAPAVDAVAPRPVSTPDAAAAAAGPPSHAGPKPTLVVSFTKGSTRVSKQVRRALRKLVNEHGYKDVHYKLTGYGAERRRPKNNRALARRRCRKVARQIRKRGVSRRWIECGPPVFRDVKRKPTEADKAPEWRRVEIRVVKP